MTLQIGDIVRWRGGLWVVTRERPDATQRDAVDVISNDECGRPLRMVVGSAHLEFVARPAFIYGDAVQHDGNAATVLSDTGDHVYVAYTTRRHFRGGGRTTDAWHVPAAKGPLTLENLSKLYREATDA